MHAMLEQGSVRAFESFGRLWKGKYNFSGPGKFWKREDFQDRYGKALDFCSDKILEVS